MCTENDDITLNYMLIHRLSLQKKKKNNNNNKINFNKIKLKCGSIYIFLKENIVEGIIVILRNKIKQYSWREPPFRQRWNGLFKQ